MNFEGGTHGSKQLVTGRTFMNGEPEPSRVASGDDYGVSEEVGDGFPRVGLHPRVQEVVPGREDLIVVVWLARGVERAQHRFDHRLEKACFV